MGHPKYKVNVIYNLKFTANLVNNDMHNKHFPLECDLRNLIPAYTVTKISK